MENTENITETKTDNKKQNKNQIYLAKDVAHYLININLKNGFSPISNLMLQTILYASQEYYLKVLGKPLFEDEIEAWQFGPVVPKVYAKFCGFGALPLSIEMPGPEVLKEEDLMILKQINTHVKFLYYNKMRTFVENPETPWSKTYDNGFGLYKVITKELIKNTQYQ